VGAIYPPVELFDLRRDAEKESATRTSSEKTRTSRVFGSMTRSSATIRDLWSQFAVES
jgi:hypothetical protein